MDVDSLRTMLDTGAPVTVLDVRTTAERSEWAIPGSVHVDAYDALKAGDPSALIDITLPADRPVVTVCGAGKTSQVAAEQLRARGYDARSLDGGMKAWSLAWNTAEVPLPLVDTRVIQVRRTGKGCLSYLIASGGEAAVIDPSLDPEIYLDLAAAYDWTITHVLETHVHADHLTRAQQLTERTGADLRVPLQERVSYRYRPLRDGDHLSIGKAALRVLTTPGHTPESSSYLLEEQALFTGDTLFLAGVGRPDLEATPAEAETRTHLLYQSLQRVLGLPPGTIVLPGHTNTPVAFDHAALYATLGDISQRVSLLRLDEDAFVAVILQNIPPAPPNHHRIVALNEAGTRPEGDLTDLEAGANRCAVA